MSLIHAHANTHPAQCYANQITNPFNCIVRYAFFYNTHTCPINKSVRIVHFMKSASFISTSERDLIFNIQSFVTFSPTTAIIIIIIYLFEIQVEYIFYSASGTAFSVEKEVGGGGHNTIFSHPKEKKASVIVLNRIKTHTDSIVNV